MSASVSSTRRLQRLWFPASIIGLTVLACIWWFLSALVDDGLRFPFALATVLAADAAVNLWWLLFSGQTSKSKAIGIGAQLAVVGLYFALIRQDGWTADMYPILSWRWSPHPELGRRNVPTVDEADVLVDMKRTTRSDSPRFLGVNGDGVIPGVRLDPDWKSHPPAELWHADVGPGWSAFAVVGDFCITQEQRGQKELVVCRTLSTGTVAWVHADEGRFSEFMGGDGPRATPTIADGEVYVMAAIGLLHRLDGQTGTPRWTRDILKDHHTSNMKWGKSCSPLVFDDLVVVTLGESPPTPSLAAYRRDTGEFVWSAGDDRAAYGTPVLATVAGRRQILVTNAHTVAGHEPETGKLLWSHPFHGLMSKSSDAHAVGSHQVFTSAGYGAGAILLSIDQKGDGLTAKPVWEDHRVMKTRFTNAVLHQESLYGLDDGILQCIALDTGKEQWKGGRYGHGQVLCIDDVLLVQCDTGDVVLVAADPQGHRELARLRAPITGKTWNYPTLAGNRLLLRNAEKAACFELPTR